MLTDSHQAISDFLFERLKGYVRPRRLGTVRYAPLRLRVGPTYREPDLLFLRAERDHLRHERYWESADLVVEIVSPKGVERDWETKKSEYALAGIPEYWIADPRDKTLTIFTLDDGATEYREAGRYKEGDIAASILLDGLTVDVAAVFAAE
jgi:Uma2 family endonuclease